MNRYYVTYYKDNIPCRYEFEFRSQFAAVFKARAIRDEHGIPTEVTQAATGWIVARFDALGRNFISWDIDDDARKIAELMLD